MNSKNQNIQKNKKNTALSTTLAVATAISAATSLPVNLVQQVQAQENALNNSNNPTNEVTQAATEPKQKVELQNKVDKANEEVVSTSTVLENTKMPRTEAKQTLDKAQKAKEDNDATIKANQDAVDSVIASELQSRESALSDAKGKLQDATDKKADLEKQIADNDAQLQTLNDKISKLKEAVESGKDTNDSNKAELDKLSQEKVKLQSNLDSLNSQKNDVEKELKSLDTQKTQTEADLKTAKDEYQEVSNKASELEKQLQEANQKVTSLQEALNKTYSDNDIAQMKQEIESLNTTIDGLNGQLKDLNANLDSKDKEIKAKEAEISEVDSKIATAQAELNAANTALTNAEASFQTANEEYIKAKNKLDDINSQKDETYNQLILDYCAAFQKQDILKEKYAAVQKDYEAAKAEYDSSATKYNNNVASFLQYIFDKTDDNNLKADVQVALEELKRYDGQKINIEENTIGLKYYDSTNFENTPFELSNFLKSLDYIRVSNAIRVREGQSELKVSLALMIESGIQNQYSSLRIAHSQKYRIAENLAWYPKLDSKQFFKEDGTIDLDRMEQIGRDKNTKEEDYYNPFVGWWIEEKVLKENGATTGFGHYENIIDSYYDITGFSVNSSKNNKYGYTFGQVFANTNKFGISGTSVDDVQNLVNEWITYKEEAKKQALSNYSAKENEKNTIYHELEKTQTALEKATEAKDAYRNQIENDYNTKLATLNDAAAQKRKAQQNVNAKTQSLASLNEQKNKLAGEKTSLDNEYVQKGEEKTNLVTQIDKNSADLKEKQSLLDSATQSKDEVRKQLEEATKNANEITAQYSKQTQLLTEASDKVDESDKKLKAINKNIEDQTVAQTKVEKDIKGTQTSLDENTKQSKAYEEAIDTYKKAVSDLNETKNTLTEINSKKAKAETDLADIEKNIAAYSGQIPTLQLAYDKVVQASEEWKEIKEEKNDEKNDEKNIPFARMAKMPNTVYGPFDDETLDGLKAKIEAYVNAKAKVDELAEAYNNAKAVYDEADAKYQDALTKYESAEEKYNTAKASYDDFVSKHGYVSEDTISVASEVTFTGKEVTPTVVVKDSKGNAVDASEYTLTYSNNIELGTATVKVEMNGQNYVGSFTKSFKVVKAEVKDDNKDKNDNKDNGNTGTVKPSTPGTSTGGNNGNSGSQTVAKPTNTDSKGNTSTSKKVKTGDEAPIVGFSLMAMLSSALYFFTKNKKEEE